MNAKLANDLAARFCGIAPLELDELDHTPTVPDVSGLYDFEYVTEDGVSLRCYLDWEGEEPQTHDAPGCSEYIVLMYAFVGIIDIAKLLDPALIEKIEAAALAEMTKEAEESAADTAIDAWEESRVFE
jgi:hypothetical protein